ncbi:MAG: hypothetical protein QME58_12110 [Bacteroidota bacterium]|nr:hypothetical protein [Bacteroidota bacterium]
MFKIRKMFYILWIPIICIGAIGCGPRQFTVLPEMKPTGFTVVEKFGTLGYIPIVDGRSEIDQEGQEPGACAMGEAGIIVLGDKNYKIPLLPEIDKHLKKAFYNSALFTQIIERTPADENYLFKSSLNQFHVVLNEQKTQQTQACVGGILGAVIASSVDVEATTDIQLTGIFLKGNEEVWRKSVSKHVLKVDDYSNTTKNLENSMGEAIGECSKEIITQLAIYLSEHK